MISQFGGVPTNFITGLDWIGPALIPRREASEAPEKQGEGESPDKKGQHEEGTRWTSGLVTEGAKKLDCR